jgi:hypothetical protein
MFCFLIQVSLSFKLESQNPNTIVDQILIRGTDWKTLPRKVKSILNKIS